MNCENSVTVSPQTITLKVGDWFTDTEISICVNDKNTTLTWYSENPTVASVNTTSGYIRANSAGTAKIYAVVYDSVDGVYESNYITVKVIEHINVEAISLNTSAITIEKGKTTTLSATCTPSNASNTNVTWTSSNSNVAQIVNGVVTGISTGTATITATSVDDPSKTATCLITVTTDILVTSITLSPRNEENLINNSLYVNQSVYLTAIVKPQNAVKKSVIWSSDNTNIATVNSNSGLIIAQSPGTTIIRATAKDGSCVVGKYEISVYYVPVTSIKISSTISIDIGKSKKISRTFYPSNASNKSLKWTSSNPDIASVNTAGVIISKKPGIVNIIATTLDGNYTSVCEVWVRGKTPVFLIHGRISNSFDVWGANNSIFTNPLNPNEKNNNHFDCSISALSIGSARCLYTSKSVQDIFSYKLGLPINVNGCEDDQFTVPGLFNGEFTNGEYINTHTEGGNLAYYLKQKEYKENINLFVFNYPNEDAVIHSAIKFQKYIENLINFVYNEGTDETKTSFFESRDAYNKNNFKINLVGHSMGGLIARYYIENLGNDDHVKKLITICTPHWGSGYANLSCVSGTSLHTLCDHDLRTDGAIYGGTFSTTLNCNALTNNCYNGHYILTDELLYSKQRNTKYYAIAAIDYQTENINSNNYTLEVPNNLNTYQDLIEYMTNNSIYDSNIFSEIIPIDIHHVGDNVVGLLSQLGWTENDGTTPNKKIHMEKIFIDVDANGGNGNNIPLLEALSMLHSKIPHRNCIMEQVEIYLNE